MPPARPTPTRPSATARRRLGLVSAVFAALAGGASGCFFTSQGLSPPTEQIYYPTGLVVSSDRSALYVANSDFDLQYNGGTVQAVNLAAVRASAGTILTGIRCSQGSTDACNLLAASDPTLLAAIRCTQASSGDCSTLMAQDPGLFANVNGCLTQMTADSQCGVQAICNSIPTTVDLTLGKACASAGDCTSGTCNGGVCQPNTGKACVSPSDCTSANCVIGSDGVNGSCQPCGSLADCPGGGICTDGLCMLGLATNQILEPAACTPVNPPFKSFASIGAFASGAVLAKNPNPGAGTTLFVPVRGDPSITWFDVADNRSPDACPTSQPSTGGLCNALSAGLTCNYETSGLGTTAVTRCQCEPTRGGNCMVDANCTLPETCGGGGMPGVCGNRCTVDANCSSPKTCGGGGTPMVCGEKLWSCAQPNPFQLDCGATGSLLRCDDNHRVGVDPFDNFRDLTLPVEPIGLDVSSDGKYIVSAHQIANGPAIGLTINDWTSGQRPAFAFYLTGVPAGPTEVASIPPAKIISDSQGSSSEIAYQPGFLVSYNLTPEIDVIRVNDDRESSPMRPFLTQAQQTPVSVNGNGNDSRGIAIDASERQACEAACAKTLDPASCSQDSDCPSGGSCVAGTCACTTLLPGFTSCCPNQPDPRSCLQCCVDTPLRVFVANRAPPTLLIGQLATTLVKSEVDQVSVTGAFDTLTIMDTASLSVGASKVALGKVIAPDGSLRNRVFAVTFDTRFIYVFDPLAPNELPAQPIRTGRGPYAIAFDACCDGSVSTCLKADACLPGEAPHAYLYVGHFTDSYLGVVDLDMRSPATFGTMFASIGVPLPPRESK